MSLKSYNPVTPGLRGLVLVDRSNLWKGKPEKTLTEGLSRTGGRNMHGHLTAYQRGGGHKRSYRLVDFKRRNFGVVGTIERLEYDPNRTTFIALVVYENGEKSYILAPQNLSPGDKVVASERVDVRPGNAGLLKNIPVGTAVHNVELKIMKGGQLARSAGASAQVLGRDAGYVLLRLTSGEVRRVHGDCMASIGVLSNADHKNENLGKAGRNRWKGNRPHVRGVAMNPIDHPHGGGEGKTSGGRHPVTPWGIATKGKRTRKNKRTSHFIVKRRYQK